MNKIDVQTRASLYQLLAEVLIDVPDWLVESGESWPLTRLSQKLANFEKNPTIQDAVLLLADIQPEDINARRQRYQAIFLENNQQPIPLSESLMRTGQLVGVTTFAVKSIYESTGVRVADSELPDHASIELAFLSYLANQELQNIHEADQWRKVRQLFIQHHAGQWLPRLGEMLVRTCDPVYMPIGYLLSAMLPEEYKHTHCTKSLKSRRVPYLQPDQSCTLCGFCVQTCPTQALTMLETPNELTLQLATSKCIGCARCVKVCMNHALQLQTEYPSVEVMVLYQSPHVCCTACGEPIISEAEFAAITAQIGTPTWLFYCLDCRALAMEEML